MYNYITLQTQVKTTTHFSNSSILMLLDLIKAAKIIYVRENKCAIVCCMIANVHNKWNYMLISINCKDNDILLTAHCHT